jgi:transposase
MRDEPVRRSKRASLKRHGTLNPHPGSVTDPLFHSSDFFDSDDLVQVKYEILRRVKVDNQPVSQSASACGFSRPTYYQAEADFEQSGLSGLLPQKRGPRRGHKLTPEVMAFVTQLRSSEPSIRPAELAAEIKRQFNVIAHPRSIERALARQEKKPH